MIDFKLTWDEWMGLTIWGEARGESIEGQVGVGHVIMNRVRHWDIKENNVKDIVLAPKQFSCWNSNDPNYEKLLHLAKDLELKEMTDDLLLRQTIYLANGIVKNILFDNTNGNLNYMTNNLYFSSKRPSWASTPKKMLVIGNHTFFTA